MTTIATVQDALATLIQIDTHAIEYEHKKLVAIKAWAMKQIGVDYGVGDRVEIGHKVVSQHGTPGWWGYREALAPGATAVVQDIDFSLIAGRWSVAIKLDREWSVSESPVTPRGEMRRFWSGPAPETPKGMIEPSTFDQEHHPEGRRHVFMLWTDDVRAHVDKSAGIE